MIKSKKKPKVTASSGNIFADLDLRDDIPAHLLEEEHKRVTDFLEHFAQFITEHYGERCSEVEGGCSTLLNVGVVRSDKNNDLQSVRR